MKEKTKNFIYFIVTYKIDFERVYKAQIHVIDYAYYFYIFVFLC